MKSRISIAFHICLLSAICFSCSLHNNNESIELKKCDELKLQGIIDSFAYPVRPGSNEWKNLKNQAEKIKAVCVPANILEEMCTRGLVYTCAYCPMFITQLLAFSSIRSGFMSLCSNINSFDELTNREDAGIELFDYYIKLTDTNLNDIKPFEYQLQIYSIELFFSQQEFLSKFNKELLNEVLLKAYGNLLVKEKFNIDKWLYVSNLYLTANILYFNIKYQPLIDFIDNKPFDIFFNTNFWNEDIIGPLRFHTEKYILEKLK